MIMALCVCLHADDNQIAVTCRGRSGNFKGGRVQRKGGGGGVGVHPPTQNLLQKGDLN